MSAQGGEGGGGGARGAATVMIAANRHASSACGVPLQQGSRPGPVGHNDVGNEAGLQRAAGGVELLRGLLGASVAVVQPHQAGGDEGEKKGEGDDDAVAARCKAGGRAGRARKSATVGSGAPAVHSTVQTAGATGTAALPASFWQVRTRRAGTRGASHRRSRSTCNYTAIRKGGWYRRVGGVGVGEESGTSAGGGELTGALWG